MLHHEIDWLMDPRTRKKSCANRTIEGSFEVGAKTSYDVHFPSPVPRETVTVN
jgi:hypothetical protein